MSLRHLMFLILMLTALLPSDRSHCMFAMMQKIMVAYLESREHGSFSMIMVRFAYLNMLYEKHLLAYQEAENGCHVKIFRSVYLFLQLKEHFFMTQE